MTSPPNKNMMRKQTLKFANKTPRVSEAYFTLIEKPLRPGSRFIEIVKIRKPTLPPRPHKK